MINGVHPPNRAQARSCPKRLTPLIANRVRRAPLKRLLRECYFFRRRRLAVNDGLPGLGIPAKKVRGIFAAQITVDATAMGVGFVPIRALALYGRKRSLKRVNWPDRFVRKLVVVVRKNREQPAHVKRFVENVLF